MLRIVLLSIMVFIGASLPASSHQDPEIAGYLAVDGGRIWYRMNGSEHLGERPAIIVAHGGPGGTHRGNMAYVKLADTFPVILYDQLGTGNSDWHGNKELWETSKFVDEIDYLRSALNLDEVIIAGHSWGGTVAAEYAVRQPKGLKAAILSSPLISTPQWNADNAEWIKGLPEDVQAILNKYKDAQLIVNEEHKAATKVFYKKHMCRKDPCSTAGYRKDGPPTNDTMYYFMWGPTDFRGIGTLRDYDLSPKLRDIEVPTLMICGEFDEAAPKSCAKFAGMIEGAKNKVVPNAGHATMAEDEALYLGFVREFLDPLTN